MFFTRLNCAVVFLLGNLGMKQCVNRKQFPMDIIVAVWGALHLKFVNGFKSITAGGFDSLDNYENYDLIPSD